MLDNVIRARLAPALDRTAAVLDARGVPPLAVTGGGLAVGVGACLAAALRAWDTALVLWLVNRALDGLDGPLARRRGATDLGGMLDFVADFVVYGGFIVGVGIADAEARVACTALLAAYLLNNVALLSFASLIEKRGLSLGDERSLRFTPGLTEGTETIVAYSVICLVPEQAAVVVWVFAAMVVFTVGQRLVTAHRVLD